ncbi:MAG: hypothetical protein OXR66_03115 [Candidatus Woesearchaeota archaeon]|nr:hypothetical protein [Candidatus Woesearchaeota archaeon]
MNRNKLIKHVVGQLANAVVHELLFLGAESEVRKRYAQEVETSLASAAAYREQINPKKRALPDRAVLLTSIMQRSETELQKRMRDGYKNIDLNKIEKTTKKFLDKLNL